MELFSVKLYYSNSKKLCYVTLFICCDAKSESTFLNFDTRKKNGIKSKHIILKGVLMSIYISY